MIPTPAETVEILYRIERYEPGSHAWQFHATALRMTAAQALDIAGGLNRRSRADTFRAVRITNTAKIEVLTPDNQIQRTLQAKKDDDFSTDKNANQGSLGCRVRRDRLDKNMEWQPIETVPEGQNVLLWFPHGEAGIGGMECAIVYRNDPNAPGGYGLWTHGGPNAGTDWNLAEAPTHWTPLPPPPNNPRVPGA